MFTRPTARPRRAPSKTVFRRSRLWCSGAERHLQGIAKKKSCIFPHASLMPPRPHQFGTLRPFVRGPKAKKGDMSQSSGCGHNLSVHWNAKIARKQRPWHRTPPLAAMPQAAIFSPNVLATLNVRADCVIAAQRRPMTHRPKKLRPLRSDKVWSHPKSPARKRGRPAVTPWRRHPSEHGRGERDARH